MSDDIKDPRYLPVSPDTVKRYCQMKADVIQLEDTIGERVKEICKTIQKIRQNSWGCEDRFEFHINPETNKVVVESRSYAGHGDYDEYDVEFDVAYLSADMNLIVQTEEILQAVRRAEHDKKVAESAEKAKAAAKEMRRQQYENLKKEFGS